MIPPRLATPRNFDRPTFGGHAAAIAAALGRPFIPLHRYVADVALEIDPSTGTFFYDRVIFTAQRQVGKTTLDGSCAIQNATMGPNRRVWYTAQDGQHATGKFLELMDVWEESPLLAGMAKKPRRSNGSARLQFLNGSVYAPHPPTADALHGTQIDRDTLDEAWSFTSAHAAALKQASVAPKLTRRKLTGHKPQSWVQSTEGTIESTFFNETLDAARAGDLAERTAIFDWGLFPDDDPTDLATVASRHPGYGYLFEMPELVSFQEEFGTAVGEFARAFGNVRTGSTERMIPLGPWTAGEFHETIPEGDVCFGAAYGLDELDAAITVSVRHGEETITAIVEEGYGPGTWWVLDRLKYLTATFGAPVVIDKYGPSAALHDDVVLADLPLVPIDSGGVTAASQKLLAGITREGGPTWRYKPHAALSAAAELVTRRYFGDGQWVLGRRKSVGSIAAIEAANLSSWGVDHLPQTMGLQLG